MAYGTLQSAATGRGCAHVARRALSRPHVAGLGVTGLGAAAGSASSTPAAKKAPEKKRRRPRRPQGGQAAQAPQSAWVKLCEKARRRHARTRTARRSKKDLNICLTHHERLDGNTGMVLVSAACAGRRPGQAAFMVMVPLGMVLQPGMRATFYPKDLWEKVQKKSRSTRSKPEGDPARLHALPSRRLHRRDRGDAGAHHRASSPPAASW